MTKLTMKPDSMQPATEMAVDLFDNWFDPIETEVRARARQFIEELIRGELDTALARPRYERSQMASNEARAGVAGHRHGSRTRSLTGTFGPIEIVVPRADDFTILTDLTDQDLEKIGVASLGHRRKLLRAMVSNSPRTSGANGNPIPLWRSLGRNESRLRASGKIGHDRACP